VNKVDNEAPVSAPENTEMVLFQRRVERWTEVYTW